LDAQLKLGLFNVFVLFLHFAENAGTWKWDESSKVHREKFIKLLQYGKDYPKEIKEVNGVRVCCSEEFLIGKGSDGTRVYVGLGKYGYERAVKRLPRDACTGLAEQEKSVLNELNATKSNYVVNYWFLDEQSDKHYLFLILDLCEETLENFVARSSVDELVTIAPDIIQKVLKGLAELHCDPVPILHRDLKPSNILRRVDGSWLLADFGISRILKTGDNTHPSKQRGTDDWRAVESYPNLKVMTGDDKVRYKKESDIQVEFLKIIIRSLIYCSVWT
jgi:serine/threonine protein kinase